MNIAFRTDATSQIGTGHFMRCLTLADALKSQGAYIRFVSRNLPAHLSEMLKAKGMDFVALPNDVVDERGGDLAHSQWLCASQTQDAHATVQALSDKQWDWIVVDHFALDARWDTAARGCAKKILVIDDIADRQHDCDVLLDQNFYSDMHSRYNDKVPAHCVKLLGPRYALLRDEFRQLRARIQPRTGAVKKILVFFGGVDADNYTGLALEALEKLANKSIKIDVVIGVQHPCREQIQQTCIVQGFECHVQTTRMAELMAEADLAIGAGGSASWERCCLGLPALSICIADNQRRQISDAAEAGLLYAPSSECVLVDMIEHHSECLLENASLLKLISRTAMDAVDGLGALRVVSVIESPKTDADNVYVRLALADDAAAVWPWRNSESTRRYFFDPSPVGLDTHVAWWKRSLVDPKRVLLIGSLGGRTFGVIRFDFDTSESAVISIYLDPAMTGKGMGRTLLLAGLSWLRENHPETNSVSAEILPENSASVRVFQSTGFSEQYRVLVLKV